MQYTGDKAEDLKSLTCNCALIYGQDSKSFGPKSVAYMQELQPALEVYGIKDAQHHLFLDQPIAFMNQLSAILDRW